MTKTHTMNTKAATFSSKIRNLQDAYHRLVNGGPPYPSTISTDLINTFKFFSQSLVSILRDIPCLPIEHLRDPSRDGMRIGLFPHLDYRTLFYLLGQFMDAYPQLQGIFQATAPTVFDYLLHAYVSMVPFLEHELMDSMPLTVANCIALSFVSHQDLIDVLCYNLLPFTLNHREVNENDLFGDFANSSVPSILMSVLSHTDALSLHSQLLECLMRLKPNIIQDLLCVIAYGTGKARHAAVELLFQYYPRLNPSHIDRKALAEKHTTWRPLTCQNETCQNTFNNEAVKICFASQIGGGAMPPPPNSGSISLSDYKGRPSLPLLICIECAESVRDTFGTSRIVINGSSLGPVENTDILMNVLNPMVDISYNCEAKGCSTMTMASGNKNTAVAVVTCFSIECTSFNSNRPVRLCATCHQSRHSKTTTSKTSPKHEGEAMAKGQLGSRKSRIKKHLIQEHLTSLWQLPLEGQQHFSEAIIALLREASVSQEKSSKGGTTSGGITAFGSSGPGLGSFGGPIAFGAQGGGGMNEFGGASSLGGMESMTGSGSGTIVGPGAPASGGIGGMPGGGGTGVAGTGAPGATEVVDSSIEERQLLSRYGIWMLVGLCDPVTEANTPERMELLGRMLAMLCQWFHYTACLPDDQAGSALERIKGEIIHGWLMKVHGAQFQLFANCLVPNPPDYAQIGGHWESWPAMNIHIKEGFKRLLCLVPYDIITADIWAYIMPFWMESFRFELAEDELGELKINLSKVLDPDLSPLGLPPKQMYHFISICFEHTNPFEQEQALSWLQILTLLEIPVPINLLSNMFLTGIRSLASITLRTSSTVEVNGEHQEAGGAAPPECGDPGPSTSQQPPPAFMDLALSDHSFQEDLAGMRLSCYVLMLDILLKQFELQEMPAHKGVDHGRDASNTINLLFEMLSTSKCTQGLHSCVVERIDPMLPEQATTTAAATTKKLVEPLKLSRNVKKPDTFLNECLFCELCSIWYQLTLQLITFFAPVVETTIMSDIVSLHDDSSVANEFGGPLGPAPASPHPSTGGEPEDEKTSLLHPIKENHGDGAAAEKQTDQPDKEQQPQDDDGHHQPHHHEHEMMLLLMDESENGGAQNDERHLASVELNLSEKLTIKLLQELEEHRDPDVLYNLLQCLKLLALHATILSRMAQDEKRRRFFLWLQQRYLVGNLWRLLQTEFSQISQIAVPLLLHCVSLPGGFSVFTHTIDVDFKNENDWCVRFAAVERVAVFSQFIEQSVVKNSASLQLALSNVFIHMINALDDSNCATSQRALLSLEAMRAAAIKLYVWCLEIQFDLVIVDRGLVLSSLLQLFNHLNERRVLTWDFFLNRFDALFLEAQVFVQRSEPTNEAALFGNAEQTRDLRNTNVHSETYKKKVSRANEALAQTHLKRSLLPHHGSKKNANRHQLSFSIFSHAARHWNNNAQAANGGTGAGISASSSAGGLLQKMSAGGLRSRPNRSDKLSRLTGGSPAAIAGSVAGQSILTPAVVVATGASVGGTMTAAISAQQAAINRKSSKLAALTGSGNFFHDTGQGKRENLQEEQHMFNIVNKIVDEECCDHETIHLLVFLFMQFLSWPDPQHPTDPNLNNATRTQAIVLRHLNTLLGFSVGENYFFLSAYEMRRKDTFTAFLSALPDVLDLNLQVSQILLPTIFPILTFCPASHTFSYSEDTESLAPNYGLWLLQPQLRLSWLNSLMVILYKHRYPMMEVQYRRFIHVLVQIVMNTLESGLGHRCSKYEMMMRGYKSKEMKESIKVAVECGSGTREEVEIAQTDDQAGDDQDEDRISILKKPQTPPPIIGATIDVTGSTSELPMTQTLTTIEAPATSEGTIVAVEGEPQDGVGAVTEEPEKASVEEGEAVEDGQEECEDERDAAKGKTTMATKKMALKVGGDRQQMAKKSAETESIEDSPCGGGVDTSDDSESLKMKTTGAGTDTADTQSTVSSSTISTCQLSDSAGGAICCHGGEGTICSLASCESCAVCSTPPPPLERLLPIGGKLSEAAQKAMLIKKKSPYPSMFDKVVGGGKQQQSTATTTTTPTPSAYCCCCCAEGATSVCRDSYCVNYRQTMVMMKQLYDTAAASATSEERLLPIGPAPVHSRSASRSRSKSRSLERQTAGGGDRLGRLKRQHTTIVPAGGQEPDGQIKNNKVSRSKVSPPISQSTPTTNAAAAIASPPAWQPLPREQKMSSSSKTDSVSSSIEDDPVAQTSAPNLINRTVDELRRITPVSSQMVAAAIAAEPGAGNLSDSSQKNHRALSKITKSSSTQSLPTTEGGGRKLKKKSRKKFAKGSKMSLTGTDGYNSSSNVTTIDTIEVARPKFDELTEVDNLKTPNEGETGSLAGTESNAQAASLQQQQQAQQQQQQQREAAHYKEYELCDTCRLPIERFSEEELGMCLVSLATFVHRDPSLAAPVLPNILKVTSRYAIRLPFPWQMELNTHLPGNITSIARQLIRCTLHQLRSNGIFRQLFQSAVSDAVLFRAVALSLADFNELNAIAPLKDVLESLLEEKALPPYLQTMHIITNIASYFEAIIGEFNGLGGGQVGYGSAAAAAAVAAAASATHQQRLGPLEAVAMYRIYTNDRLWSELNQPLADLLKRLSVALPTMAPTIHNLVPIVRLLLSIFKVHGISLGAMNGTYDSITKILVHCCLHSPLILEQVRELSICSARTFGRQLGDFKAIPKIFTTTLVNGLRFRLQLPDENIVLLVQWILEDVGGSLPYSLVATTLERHQTRALGLAGISIEPPGTHAADALRVQMSETIEFVGDMHAIAKIKSNFQGTSVHLNEETLGGHLKAGVAQFLALELTKIGSRDHQGVTKYLPWLYTLPSLQQGSKEFLECLSHVRILCWILLGSLQHTALMKCHPSQATQVMCQPIPLEANGHIAEHVQAILAGFVDQQRASVQHMSSLFYAFLLCQVWTIYCEQLASHNPPGSDAAQQIIMVLSDFWSKVTPGVLQLIGHSKNQEELQQLADTVSLHFLSLMETLLECNSEILARLIPLWLPLFNSYQGQSLSATTRHRLQSIVSWPSPAQTRDDAMMISTTLIRWLQRIQTKMSQMEMQSSAASQFYCA